MSLITSEQRLNSGFKDSGADWIGMIPNNWDVKAFKRFMNINNGCDYKHIIADEGYPVIGSGGVFEHASQYLYDGEVLLLGRKGTIDKPMYFKGKFWTVDTMFYCIPNKNVSCKYMYYQALVVPLLRFSTQTALPSMTQTSLNNIQYCVPPLPVQQRIVSYLDDKTEKIDKAVSFLQKKRDAYTRLKSSIINRAVTRGLNPNVKLKDSGVEWIGMIPENWDLIPFKGNIKLLKGRTPSELTFEKDDLPYLTMDYLRGRSDKSAMYPINSDGLIPIKANEILVLWDGANAGEFLLSKKGYLGSTMAMISVNERRYSKEYFFYLLKSIEPTSKYFANGTTIPHFSPDIFYGRCYPCPPLKEQIAIASYLDTHCSRIDHAISIVDKQIDAYTRLKKSLINEVVTGKRKV